MAHTIALTLTLAIGTYAIASLASDARRFLRAAHDLARYLRED